MGPSNLGKPHSSRGPWGSAVGHHDERQVFGLGAAGNGQVAVQRHAVAGGHGDGPNLAEHLVIEPGPGIEKQGEFLRVRVVEEVLGRFLIAVQGDDQLVIVFRRADDNGELLWKQPLELELQAGDRVLVVEGDEARPVGHGADAVDPALLIELQIGGGNFVAIHLFEFLRLRVHEVNPVGPAVRGVPHVQAPIRRKR